MIKYWLVSLISVSARDEVVGLLREKYLKALEDMSKNIVVEKTVKAEAVRRIDILAEKSVTLGGDPRAVLGGLVFLIENEKGMPDRSPKLAEALNLAGNSVTENSRRLAIHFRKS